MSLMALTTGNGKENSFYLYDVEWILGSLMAVYALKRSEEYRAILASWTIKLIYYTVSRLV